MRICRNCLVTLRQQVSLADGTVVDDGSQPIAYVHGGYQDIFEPIEKALTGKSAGERISVILKPQDTYGLIDESLRKVEPLDRFPTPPRPGDQVEGSSDESGPILRVVEVTENEVLLDGNHPFAGLELTFAAEILEVRTASQEEVMRASRAVRVNISRRRALWAAVVSLVAAPAVLLLVVGGLIDWLGSGVLAYGVLALGIAVLLAVLWQGLQYVQDLWRGGQVLHIDVQGIRWRGWTELVRWDMIDKIACETMGDESWYTVSLADKREFRIDASVLTLEAPQISWLFAQYLPATKLKGM